MYLQSTLIPHTSCGKVMTTSRFDCAQKLISGIHHSAQISWTSADSIQGFFNFCLTVTIIRSKYSLVRRTPYNGGVRSILNKLADVTGRDVKFCVPQICERKHIPVYKAVNM